MDIGTGIAAGTAVIMAGIALIKLVKSPVHKSDGRCPAHSGVELSLQKGEKRMDKISTDIAIVRRIVVAIASELKVPLDKIKTELQDMVE